MTTQVLNTKNSSRQVKSAEANARISALADIFSPRETKSDIDLSQFNHSKQQFTDPNQSEFAVLTDFLGMLGLTR